MHDHACWRHQLRSIVDLVTIGNGCVVCGSTFKNREAARRHLKSSIRQDRCLVNGFVCDYKPTEPEGRRCHICSKVFISPQLLRSHLAAYLSEWPSQIWVPKDVCSQASSEVKSGHAYVSIVAEERAKMGHVRQCAHLRNKEKESGRQSQWGKRLSSPNNRWGL